MKNTSAFEPERSPGVSETPNIIPSRDFGKDANVIEGIGEGFPITAIPNQVSEFEICRIWFMQSTKQDNEFELTYIIAFIVLCYTPGNIIGLAFVIAVKLFAV
jgi:hypothetical protein